MSGDESKSSDYILQRFRNKRKEISTLENCCENCDELFVSSQLRINLNKKIREKEKAASESFLRFPSLASCESIVLKLP